MRPLTLCLMELTHPMPNYSVYEGRELVGALEFRGHLFLATFVFPAFVAGDALAIAHFSPSARARLASALASMMRDAFETRTEGLN